MEEFNERQEKMAAEMEALTALLGALSPSFSRTGA
jgi:hypothetical protein